MPPPWVVDGSWQPFSDAGMIQVDLYQSMAHAVVRPLHHPQGREEGEHGGPIYLTLSVDGICRCVWVKQVQPQPHSLNLEMDWTWRLAADPQLEPQCKAERGLKCEGGATWAASCNLPSSVMRKFLAPGRPGRPGRSTPGWSFFPLGGFNVFQVSTHPNYINIIYTVKSTVGWNGMDHPRMNGNLSSLSNIKTTSR